MELTHSHVIAMVVEFGEGVRDSSLSSLCSGSDAEIVRGRLNLAFVGILREEFVEERGPILTQHVLLPVEVLME